MYNIYLKLANFILVERTVYNSNLINCIFELVSYIHLSVIKFICKQKLQLEKLFNERIVG
jgi:hypothetical protein